MEAMVAILVGVLVVLFLLFGLKAFIDFLEEIAKGLLSLAVVGIIAAIIVGIVTSML